MIYKIGSSCIANRLKLVLHNLINEDQTGFIRNRYIGDNIRLIYDTISYLDDHDLSGLLLNIDFEKAFDSISWEFMFKVLKAFGFQKDICKWISVFYKGIKSCVIVNGQVSDWFSIKRGCRQGDPVSPYLFILCAEILAIMIRENPDIHGIIINGVEYKLSQYADDTELFLSGDRKSFETCVETLFRFGRVSGLHVNSSKTNVVWLGNKKKSDIRYMQHLGLDWNPSKFKILGIWFTNDLKECIKLNYSERLADINHLFKVWVKRQLTPMGRVAVLKSLILSKLTHLWLLLPNPPEAFFQTCQKLCYKFIWNNKPDKISRKVAHKSVKEGGIGIPELKTFVSSLKLSWIRKVERSSHKWKTIFLANFPNWEDGEKYGPEFVSNFRKHNIFWTEVFEAYQQFFYKCIPKTSAELLSEPICFNKNIQIGKKCIVSNALRRKNIYFLSDCFDCQGKLLSYTSFKEKYSLNIDFVTFAGFKSAVIEYIKKRCIIVKSNKYITPSLCFKRIFSIFKGSRMYYDTLIASSSTPKSCDKWDGKLSVEHDWKICFLLAHKIDDVKLKWFQLRIIHRCLCTNVILKEIGVVDNDNCNLCGLFKDSIDHMFWKCLHAQYFWETFVNWVKEKCVTADRLQLSESLVLLGHDSRITIDDVLYFILLFAKYHMFTCKLENKYPHILAFQNKSKDRYKVEEHIAYMKMTHTDFSAKWFPYKSLILTS